MEFKQVKEQSEKLEYYNELEELIPKLRDIVEGRFYCRGEGGTCISFDEIYRLKRDNEGKPFLHNPNDYNNHVYFSSVEDAYKANVKISVIKTAIDKLQELPNIYQLLDAHQKAKEYKADFDKAHAELIEAEQVLSKKLGVGINPSYDDDYTPPSVAKCIDFVSTRLSDEAIHKEVKKEVSKIGFLSMIKYWLDARKEPRK